MAYLSDQGIGHIGVGMSGSDLFTGTLDILLLRMLMHGYAIGRAIREGSEGVLSIDEGALYPALRAA